MVRSLGRIPASNTVTAPLSRLSSFVCPTGSWRLQARLQHAPPAPHSSYILIVRPLSYLAVLFRPALRWWIEGGLDNYMPPRNPRPGAAMCDQGILLLVVIRLRQPVDIGDIDLWPGRRPAQTTWLPVLSEWPVHAPAARYFPSQARWESFTPDNTRVSILQPPLLDVALARCAGRGTRNPIKLQHPP